MDPYNYPRKIVGIIFLSDSCHTLKKYLKKA